MDSDDPSHLIWLDEFLQPAFERVDEVPADCRVVLKADTGGYLKTLRTGRHPGGREVACFSVDGGVMRLPLWQPVDGKEVLFDRTFRVFYLVDRHDPEIDVLTPRCNVSARNGLMRVVRELAMMSVHRTGNLIVHGAAFLRGDRGVVIAGPKKAGKTTLLIHILQNSDARFIANDRVVVSSEGPRPSLRGMPTVVTLRQHTTRRFPALQAELLARRYHHRRALGESSPSRRPPRPFGDEGLWSLSPAQFATSLNIERAAHGPLSSIVFPQVTGRSGAIELQELAPDEAARKLSGLLFNASARAAAEAFDWRDGTGAEEWRPEPACLALTSPLRCWEARLGRDTYRSGAAAKALLDRLGL